MITCTAHTPSRLPGGREKVAVNPSERGQSHGDGHDPGEHPQQLLTKRLQSTSTHSGQVKCLTRLERVIRAGSEVTHHGDSVGRQQLLGGHGGEVGDVGKSVHQRDQRNGDVNCTRQVPAQIVIFLLVAQHTMHNALHTHTHIFISPC